MATDVIPEIYWTSRGHSQLYAEGMVSLQKQLMRWTTALKLRPRFSKLEVKLFPVVEDTLLHDDVLLPLWKDFSVAISSVAADSYESITFAIVNVQLTQPVLELLAPALNKLSANTWIMMNNRLPCNSLEILSNFVECNTSLEGLAFCNEIESELGAKSLVRAVKNHAITNLCLQSTGLGQSHAVMKAIFPALRNSSLKAISLQHNEIGSLGASLISDFLGANPILKILHLENNLLNDKDVLSIAKGLRSNRNLRELILHDNNFGSMGAAALCTAVYEVGNRALETIYDSNHTCDVKFDYNLAEPLFGRPFLPTETDVIFNSIDAWPNRRRTAKILWTVLYTMPHILIHHLNDVSIEIMPHVLAVFQKLDNAGSLYQIFQVIREWKMPLLFTGGKCKIYESRNRSKIRREEMSSNSVSLRRSDRLRKKYY